MCLAFRRPAILPPPERFLGNEMEDGPENSCCVGGDVSPPTRFVDKEPVAQKVRFLERKPFWIYVLEICLEEFRKSRRRKNEEERPVCRYV